MCQEQGTEKDENGEEGVKKVTFCYLVALSYFLGTRKTIYPGAADAAFNIAPYHLRKANIEETYTDEIIKFSF